MERLEMVKAAPKAKDDPEFRRTEFLMQPPHRIFVFGSNLAGHHGAGAAKYAKTFYGAVEGNGVGRQGRSYAIPTKNRQLQALRLHTIEGFVNDFIAYAREHPELQFVVTRIGCGYARYTDAQIGPLFKDAPKNCLLPPVWNAR